MQWAGTSKERNAKEVRVPNHLESWFADQLVGIDYFFRHAPTPVREPRHPCSPRIMAQTQLQTLSDAETPFPSGAPVSVGHVAAEPYGNGRPDIFSVHGMHTPGVHQNIKNHSKTLDLSMEYPNATTWSTEYGGCGAFRDVSSRHQASRWACIDAQ
jgi:hypothetical protein